MPFFICTTCGTQYAEADEPPAACAVCQDERQYVKATGQQWTTLDKLRPDGEIAFVDRCRPRPLLSSTLRCFQRVGRVGLVPLHVAGRPVDRRDVLARQT